MWQLIIEYLSFDIPQPAQAAFIAHDAAIWTPALARSDGFLGKEVWRQRDQPTWITLVIRWRAKGDWDAVDRELLARTQAVFVAALGEEYPVLSCTAFEVVSPA